MTVATKSSWLVCSAAAALALAAAAPANACSICRCGDATFNALGKDVTSEPGWRFAFDFERFSKTQGADTELESVVERRYTAVGAYTIGDRAMLMGRLPYTERTLQERDGSDVEVSHASGLGDPEIYGQIRLWSSPLRGDLGRRMSLSAVVGVKTDWGENDMMRDGVRLDEHVQPATGSTDPFIGLSGYYLIDTKSSLFASVQRRVPGENDFGYRYGRISLVNFAYERKLSDTVDSVVELNYRHAGRDRIDANGALDPDTGGGVLYVTPRVLLNVRGLVLRFAAQVPVSESLHGEQREKTVYNVGITRSFGKQK